MSAPHRLSAKDPDNLRAVCSVCGPVDIRRAGNSFQCAVKKAQGKKAWKARNPDRVAASRNGNNPHILHSQKSDTAICVLCGPVDTVPWGRGRVCGVMARQRRSVQESVPHGRCMSCWVEVDPGVDVVEVEEGEKPPVLRRHVVWLRADGSCPRCSDPVAADLGRALREGERGLTSDEVELVDLAEVGFSVGALGAGPDAGNRLETVTPYLRVIGSATRAWNEV